MIEHNLYEMENYRELIDEVGVDKSVCMDLPILCFIIHCSDRVQDSVIHRRHSGSSDRNDHILYSRKA